MQSISLQCIGLKSGCAPTCNASSGHLLQQLLLCAIASAAVAEGVVIELVNVKLVTAIGSQQDTRLKKRALHACMHGQKSTMHLDASNHEGLEEGFRDVCIAICMH